MPLFYAALAESDLHLWFEFHDEENQQGFCGGLGSRLVEEKGARCGRIRASIVPQLSVELTTVGTVAERSPTVAPTIAETVAPIPATVSKRSHLSPMKPSRSPRWRSHPDVRQLQNGRTVAQTIARELKHLQEPPTIGMSPIAGKEAKHPSHRHCLAGKWSVSALKRMMTAPAPNISISH